jgi:hypothetical protein
VTHYLLLYVHVKSLNFNWTEIDFIGKNVSTIAPFVSEKWSDLEIKGFTVHELKSENCLIYYMEIHYRVDNNNEKIITNTKNMIICEKNGIRRFSKTRNCSGKNMYEYAIIPIFGYPMRIAL